MRRMRNCGAFVERLGGDGAVLATGPRRTSVGALAGCVGGIVSGSSSLGGAPRPALVGAPVPSLRCCDGGVNCL